MNIPQNSILFLVTITVAVCTGMLIAERATTHSGTATGVLLIACGLFIIMVGAALVEGWIKLG